MRRRRRTGQQIAAAEFRAQAAAFRAQGAQEANQQRALAAQQKLTQQQERHAALMRRQERAFGGGERGALGAIRSVTGAFGRFGLAVEGVKQAFDLLTGTVRETAANLRTFGREQGLAGATAEQTAAFTAITGSAEGMAALAAQLRQRLGSNAFAIQELGYQGPREFGNVNEGEALQRGIQRLRALQGNQEEQLRVARILGLESLLEYVNVSKAAQAEQDRLTEALARANSPANTAAAREFAAWQSMVGQRWQILMQELTMPVLEAFTQDLRELSNVLAAAQGALGGVRKEHEERTTRLQAAMEREFGPAPKGMSYMPGRMGAGKKPPADPVKAQDENTKALVDLTNVMRQQAGGGIRSARALPPALLHPANRAWVQHHTWNLRGFRGF